MKEKKESIISGILFAIAMTLFIGSIIMLMIANRKNVLIVTEIDKDVSYSMVESTISETYQKASKSCVGIACKSKNKSASGSGVIYKNDNETYYVVTNYHVVNGFDSLYIYYEDEYEEAKLVGGDSDNDVAVLTFSFSANNKTRNDVIVCDFLNYSTYKIANIGETTLIIGCPAGIENYNTLTTGVVCQKSLTEIGTDAVVNVGNSGGGMFNINGELLGLVYRKETATAGGTTLEGRGFAIALSVVMASVKQIEKNNDNVENAKLPFQVTCVNRVLNADSELCDYMPDDDANSHLVINHVINYKNFDIEGLDVLLKIDDVDMNTVNDVKYVLKTKFSGDEVTLTLYRKNVGIITSIITL